MSAATLKRAIDRMVEDAIRRILPAVMNEVLVATIARGTAGVVSEERVRPRKQARKKRPVREQVVARPKTRPQPKRDPRSVLSDLLDESAGSEFYGSGEAADNLMDEDDNPAPSSMAQRIGSLPPEIRGLAEGLELDGDGGEMWGTEHDSGDTSRPVIGEIRNIENAAQHAGIDFSRMKAVIGATSPRKPMALDDTANRVQFEQARLKRMRERLNDGKPVE